jgi:sialate O-acetylesterase
MAGWIDLATGFVAGRAEEKLVPGKDRIDVPAIGDGLCLHNLFQTGMVLQRDKPIRIWGWAVKGDTITLEFAGQTRTAQDSFTIYPVNPACPP